MRRNEPTTQTEIPVDPQRPLVSRTDLSSRITYANPAFVKISGFSKGELIGQPHNIVRHPDMPQAAFADLWRTIQSGQPWRGLVKNRCANGDFYWVDAYVTSLTEQGRPVGYMSVRGTPGRDQVAQAEALYRAVNEGRARFPATHWPRTLALQWRAALVLLAALLPVLATALWPQWRWGWVVLAALVAGAGWLWLRASWRAPLARVVDAFSSLAEGNFRFEVDTKAPTELAAVLLRLESMRINLRAIIADVIGASGDVGRRADELAHEAQSLRNRATTQSGGMSSVVAALEQLNVSVQEIHQSTQLSAEHAGRAADLSVEGAQVVAQAQAVNHEAVKVIERARETLGTLNQAVQEINAVTLTIRGIAEQTNLLALNASIEAARAGEQGRGFAVVADEVRQLAERTSYSTGTISNTIQAVADRAARAIEDMDQAVSAVQRGVGVIDSCNATLQEIRDASQSVGQSTQGIDAMLDQQAQAAHDVANNMEQISALAEQNSNSVGQVTQSAAHLAQVAEALQALLRQFEKSL
ncbi:methyl-accepting chemotaxis protein [Chitiniphilus purpureus]|uniref:Methyl-accepting chemotaxis protein n=1 Tax=Chitiniphilus purpureus TaxID=2981137 RepID=A0ABY6DS50_9NEIS|nr:PAS domain-containing methyl-accepting chemotaxis protein [Chitiniphilus sp. CD1]UXY17191.1 methyl-accepting chemotaxis protein [Chitiniphilus sp. CD1]